MIIGVLDSGLGGLSTLAELIRWEVSDYYIYYADNYNAPYGTKNGEQIKNYAACACNHLIKLGAEAIVLACNTATSSVINKLRAELTVPIFGLEPAIRPALAETLGKVLVLATDYTLNGEKWHKLSCEFVGDYEVKTMSRLAELVDDYYPYSMDFLKDYIYYELQSYCDIKSVVLGCTHYILVDDLISEALNNARTFDGNEGLAKLMSSIFNSPKKSVDIELIFSGEKQCARYADILKHLVEK